MNYLVDTHIVLWASARSARLPEKAAKIIADPSVNLFVSAITFWEVAIKTALKKPGFNIDVAPLRAGLFSNGYTELPIESRHVLMLPAMPFHHTDPFDRLLVAQSLAEAIPLLTADQKLADYGEYVQVV